MWPHQEILANVLSFVGVRHEVKAERESVKLAIFELKCA